MQNQAFDYNINANTLATSVDNIPKTYGFVYFKPTPSNIQTTDIKKCYAKNEYTNQTGLEMKLISDVLKAPNALHTRETCKFNAGLLQKKQKETEQYRISQLSKNPGLVYKVVEGYFSDNITHFEDSQSIIKDGISQDLTSIKSATDGFITNTTGSRKQFSVEWNGFFIPTQTGNWKFGINSGDSAFLWIGDDAINDYTKSNSFVNNNGIHSVQYKENSGYFIKDKIYPIRIQYGQNNNGGDFQLKAIGPDGSPAKHESILMNIKNPDGTMFEKKMIYYALVDSDDNGNSAKNGLFNCYVNEVASNSYSDIKGESKYSYKTVWELFNTRNQSQNIHPGNYLFMDASNNIFIQNDSTHFSQMIASLTSGQIKLGDDGNFFAEATLGGWTNISNIDPQSDVTNTEWKDYKLKYNIKESFVFKQNSTIACNNAAKTILISNNNRYKLEFNQYGNLIIKTSKFGCTGKNSDTNGEFKYTSQTDNIGGNNYYLYRVDTDETADNYYLANNDLKTLKQISNTNDILRPSTSYTKYDNYYPANLNNFQKTDKDCNTVCDEDASCKHYYSIKKADGNGCIIEKERLPKQFLPKPLFNNNFTSTLYIKNMNTNFDENDKRNKAPMSAVIDYRPYSEYKILNSNISKGEKYSGFDEPILTQLKKNDAYIGTGASKDGFENYGYQNSQQVGTYYGNQQLVNGQINGNAITLPTAINEYQIKPLRKIADDYSTLQSKINQNAVDLSNNISKITNQGGTGMRDLLMADSAGQNLYDFSGNTFNYRNRKPTVTDALNEDIKTMILQENYIYILGTLTTATLLIAAVYLAK